MKYGSLKVVMILISVLILYGCKSGDSEKELAVNAYYFYEFIDHTDGQIDEGLSDFLNSYFQRYDYVMNEESMSAEWPFYMEIERGSKYYKSDLTPPHYSVHIMKPFKEWQESDKSESYRVEIHYLESTNESIMVHFINKKKKDGQWIVHADPKPASFVRLQFSTREELYEFIGKSLIRDVFK